MNFFNISIYIKLVALNSSLSKPQEVGAIHSLKCEADRCLSLSDISCHRRYTSWPTDGGECLGDDEDVVNSNAEEYEGDHSMGRGVEEAEQRTETVAHDHAHGYTETDNYCY